MEMGNGVPNAGVEPRYTLISEKKFYTSIYYIDYVQHKPCKWAIFFNWALNSAKLF